MVKTLQIQDNFILKRRDWYMMETKDCFGHYGSCTNTGECLIRMECLKKRIEGIRKRILGKKLSLKLKR